MTFKLGKTSMTELATVHPKLQEVVLRAIQISKQDFAVNDGARSLEEQKENVRKGFSKTMKSRHLTQKDGYGHAVDLVPYVNGKVVWDWNAIWDIAEAMRVASEELNAVLTWGAVWDKRLGTYGAGVPALKEAVEKYKKRHPGPDFIDGPHYQIEGV